MENKLTLQGGALLMGTINGNRAAVGIAELNDKRKALILYADRKDWDDQSSVNFGYSRRSFYASTLLKKGVTAEPTIEAIKAAIMEQPFIYGEIRFTHYASSTSKNAQTQAVGEATAQGDLFAETKPQPQAQPTAPAGGLEATLAAFIVPQVQAQLAAQIQGIIAEQVQAALAAQEPAKVEHHIIINGEEKAKIEGIVHPVFDKVVKQLASGKFGVYMHGPAGTGKGVLVKQVAQAMGLDLYSDNCIFEAYQAKGYNDAGGNFHETQLTTAVRNGGLYFLDEADASDPQILTSLNSLLADGYMTLDNGERIERHPNFRCIAAGNTIGRGATDLYSARTPMDAATLNRFFIDFVDYSHEVEKGVAKNGAGADKDDACAFLWELREIAKRKNLNEVLSTRELERLVMFDAPEAVEYLSYRFDEDTKRQLFGALKSNDNTYNRAAKAMI